ncbi:effector-associated constant component EACC1 [Kitasatospora cineracea]|uniref:effector-associated constant component EACC1 n=1 Tax=Kitasatospora cineracea TaxID=88074 RepID=UPI0037A764BB
MTGAQIRLSGADPIGETAALWEWLRGEEQLRGLVRAVTPPPGEGELGGAVEVLQVALGATGAAGVLARSLTVWLRTRRSDLKVTVTRDGATTVEVSNLAPDQVEGILRRALDGGTEPGGGTELGGSAEPGSGARPDGGTEPDSGAGPDGGRGGEGDA